MAPTHIGIVQVSGKGRFNPPQSIDLSDFHVTALGGAFTGKACCQNMTSACKASWSISICAAGASVRSEAAAVRWRDLRSGAGGGKHQDAERHRRARRSGHRARPPGASRFRAGSTRITTVAPTRITLARSYVALPSTRLDLSGSLGRQIQVKLVSHNLKDFAAWRCRWPRRIAVELRGGVGHVYRRRSRAS